MKPQGLHPLEMLHLLNALWPPPVVLSAWVHGFKYMSLWVLIHIQTILLQATNLKWEDCLLDASPTAEAGFPRIPSGLPLVCLHNAW